MNKLYRSRKSRWFTGLCGGIGEYFDINPNVIRIAALLLELSPFGVIAYFLVSYFVPLCAEQLPEAEKETESNSDENDAVV